MPEKLCIDCGSVKPLTDFYKRAECADGYCNQCKVCQRAAFLKRVSTQTAGVYRLYWAATGQFYIGATKYLDHRKRQHLAFMNSKRHPNSRVQQAFNEHGSPEFQVLVICKASELDAKEAEQLNAAFGGGKCLNIFKRSPEHVRALGKAGNRKAYKMALNALPEYLAVRRKRRAERQTRRAD